MRSSTERGKKYKSKVDGSISKTRIDRYGAEQKARFTSAVIDQTKIEQEVKRMAVDYNAPTMLMHFYTNFGKKCCQLKKRFGGINLCTELDAATNAWYARGLNRNLLCTIREYYVPTCPCELLIPCETLLTKEECEAAGCCWTGLHCIAAPCSCEDYETQVECEANDCYWYDGSCHSEPAPPPEWLWNTEHTPDINCLLLHHHEDNAANTIVLDSSGNGWNSTANANTNGIYVAGGKFNGGFYANDLFAASNANAGLVAAINAACATTLTFEVWIKNDSLDWSAHGAQHFFVFWVNASNFIRMNYDAGTNSMYAQFVAGGVSKYVIDASVVDTDTWHHVAMTINKTGDELKMFIDGVQVGLTVNGLGVWAGVGGTLYLYSSNVVNDILDGIADEAAISNVIRY